MLLVDEAATTADIPGVLDLDARSWTPHPTSSTIVRHPARGHGAAALHQRHDGHAQGRGARPRGGGRTTRDRALRARPARRRRLLVHGRSRAGSPAPPTASSRRCCTASRSIVDEGDFDAERWYGILEDQRVSVWYTAPTAIRMLMRAGADARRARTTFRRCGSSPASASRSTPRPCGGASEALGLPIHDNWWQTETGGIMIANYAGDADQARARWAGRCPASRPAIVGAATTAPSSRWSTSRARASWRLRRGWPSMFRGYLGDDGALPQLLRRRLVPHRRPRPPRRRRLLLVRRARRRRHQVGRATSSARSRSRARCWSTRRWPRPA